MLNPSFKVPVLNIVGEFSPILEETIALNGKLNPAATNWLKLLVSHHQSKNNYWFRHPWQHLSGMKNDSFCLINNIFEQSKMQQAIFRDLSCHLGLTEPYYNGWWLSGLQAILPRVQETWVRIYLVKKLNLHMRVRINFHLSFKLDRLQSL